MKTLASIVRKALDSLAGGGGLALCVTAFAASAALAGTDSADEVKYLYMNAFSGTSWGGTFRSTAEAQDPAETLKWDDSAVLVFEANTSYGSDVSCERTCAGYLLQKAPPRLEGGKKEIGAFGICSEVSCSWNWWSDGPYKLTASQTWRGPDATALSTKPFIVAPSSLTSYRKAGYNGAFTTAADATWTLAGDMVLMMYAISNDFSSCDIVVRKPAILALPRHNHFYVAGNRPQLKARSITIDGGVGLYFGANTKSGISIWTGETETGIGCSPEIDPLHVSSRINLADDATLTALETTSVSGGVTIAAVDSATASLSGTFSIDDATTIRVEAGSTLDLTGAELVGEGRITFAGGGTLVLDVAKVSAPYSFSAEAPALNLAGGRSFVPAAALADLTADLSVVSGTLVLESVAAIPAGRKVVTSGDAKLLLVDATGFDAATHLGGTQGYEEASRLVVTDAAVSGAVQVGAGETIEIWGDGLGAAASLEATCGATIRFMRSATVSAPLVTSNSVTFATALAATGTVAGAWTARPTADADQQIRIEAPGLLRFEGGATIGAKSPFCVMGGSRAEIVGKKFLAASSLQMYGGHLTIRDGGFWQQNAMWTHLYMNMEKQTEDATVEIGPGGKFQRCNNGPTYIGRAGSSFTSRLYINGGLFETAITDSFNLYANGVLEIDNGGFFSMETAVTCESGDPRNGRIVLGRGTWGNKIVYSGLNKPLVLSGGSFPVEVTGDFLFDFNSLKSNLGNVVTNTSSEASAAGAWTFRSGSCLRVRGRAGAERTTFLVKNAVVEPGARFDLGATNPVANVEFANGGADLALTWVCPPADAAAGSVGSIVGHGGALAASYYVPAGMTFENAQYGVTDWASGFDAVSAADLAFADGATWKFPFFGADEPLEIGGALVLPSALNYVVQPKGLRATVRDVPVARTAAGVAGGPCAWTCRGGLKGERATFATVDGSLCLSYDGRGAMVIIR